jgi:hypothetical protein
MRSGIAHAVEGLGDGRPGRCGCAGVRAGRRAWKKTNHFVVARYRRAQVVRERWRYRVIELTCRECEHRVMAGREGECQLPTRLDTEAVARVPGDWGEN